MKGELGEFKIMISYMIDEIIRDAVAHGATTEDIFHALGAEALELSARIHINHGGCDGNFLGMARDVLALVRLGAPSQ